MEVLRLRGLVSDVSFCKLEGRDHLFMNGGLNNCLMAERWVVRIIKWDGLKINKLHHAVSVVWGAIDSRRWGKMLDEGVHGENFKHAIQYWILCCIWKMPICYVYNFGLNLKARAVYELGEVSRVIVYPAYISPSQRIVCKTLSIYQMYGYCR